MVIELTDDNFDKEVIEADVPVLVDFWAGWCQPCKLIAPFVEQLDKELGDTVKFCKYDVEHNTKKLSEYGVGSLPTILFFKGGYVVDQVVGAVHKDRLSEKLLDL
jgi:thioredoxin 1|tara:strand:- start:3125 stop:3439 length:315 start_codon:yes stop_codon:yes gene_type:complete